MRLQDTECDAVGGLRSFIGGSHAPNGSNRGGEWLAF